LGLNDRTFTVPVVDPVFSSTNRIIMPAAVFQIRQRDTLDYSVDASGWLAANGSALLGAVAWGVANDSPMQPIIMADSFDPTGLCTVVVAPAADAAVGDVYWIDWSAATTPTQIPRLPNVTIPPRTVVRRFYIMVVAG
jgi:hypothetical protein